MIAQIINLSQATPVLNGWIFPSGGVSQFTGICNCTITRNPMGLGWEHLYMSNSNPRSAKVIKGTHNKRFRLTVPQTLLKVNRTRTQSAFVTTSRANTLHTSSVKTGCIPKSMPFQGLQTFYQDPWMGKVAVWMPKHAVWTRLKTVPTKTQLFAKTRCKCMLFLKCHCFVPFRMSRYTMYT